MAQGDWLCDACAAGAPPPRRARALTAVDKFLAGRLGLARVEGFWARGGGPPMVDLRWFLRPEDLHTGRLVRCSLPVLPSVHAGRWACGDGRLWYACAGACGPAPAHRPV